MQTSRKPRLANEKKKFCSCGPRSFSEHSVCGMRWSKPLRSKTSEAPQIAIARAWLGVLQLQSKEPTTRPRSQPLTHKGTRGAVAAFAWCVHSTQINFSVQASPSLNEQHAMSDLEHLTESIAHTLGACRSPNSERAMTTLTTMTTTRPQDKQETNKKPPKSCLSQCLLNPNTSLTSKFIASHKTAVRGQHGMQQEPRPARKSKSIHDLQPAHGKDLKRLCLTRPQTALGCCLTWGLLVNDSAPSSFTSCHVCDTGMHEPNRIPSFLEACAC